MNIINIINEEIKEFDFLSNNKQQEEDDNLILLKNIDFQKQFIIDSLKSPEKINTNSINVKLTGDWKDSESTDLIVDYSCEINYIYDNDKNAVFRLNFEGRDISYHQTDDDRWFNGIDLKEVYVNYLNKYGNELSFTAYDQAPDKIKYLFKRKYIGNLFK